VGLRKVVGAERGQLIRQFLFESAITNSIAMVLAFFLAYTFTPYVNQVADLQLGDAIWTQPMFWGVFVVIFGITTLLAGLYPAFVLSSFKPVDSLKGEAGLFSGQLWLRRGLVVFQFAAAVILICGTNIVYNQLSYMRSLDLGLDLDQVITVPGPRVLSDGVNPAEARSVFADELRRLPGVHNVATSWRLPGEGFNWNGASTWRAENEEASAITAVVTYIDTSFVNLYDLELVAGRNFFEATAPFGSTSPSDVLANETVVRSLGFVTAEEALNHPLKIGGMDVQIVGVLRDFNWTSAHIERQNIFFGRTTAGGYVSVRVDSGNLQNIIASIEETYTTLFAGNPFTYSFADQQFYRQYRNDQRFATLFAGFSGLAIFIACLGLFGLSANTARKRTKEIGIRKVLGASVLGIVSLLSRDFIKLVILSILIAVPVSWYAMNRWLEDFAYRIEIGADAFLLAGLAAVLIALITVSWQSVKTAMMNPVKSLRTE
jgi:putative ABC transport system permease protein